MNVNPTVRLYSVEAYNRLYGFPTQHPLVSVINMRDAAKSVNHVRMDYGVYAIFLKNGKGCTLRYGRKEYDYDKGTVVTFSPGQLIDVDSVDDDIAPDVLGLLFHPDLILGTPLAEKIGEYGFFDYSQCEALHLSLRERELFVDCVDRISRELQNPADSHTNTLISANIQLLLEYLNRFYDRQFATRKKVNNDIIRRFERDLRDCFASGESRDGLPSVAYFADKVNLTPGYFGDLVKKELGVTAKDMINSQIIAVAKQRLTTSDDDISIIAYDLGFRYPQHFTRMFSKSTGESPEDSKSKCKTLR